MDKTQVVHKLQSICSFLDDGSHFFLAESELLLDKRVDLPSCGVLGEDVEMLLIVKVSVEVDDIDMSQGIVYPYFLGYLMHHFLLSHH